MSEKVEFLILSPLNVTLILKNSKVIFSHQTLVSTVMYYYTNSGYKNLNRSDHPNIQYNFELCCDPDLEDSNATFSQDVLTPADAHHTHTKGGAAL